MNMARLKQVEVALILKRVEAHHPEESKLLEGHIATLTAEETWATLVREVVESMAASRNAEDRTSESLLSLRPLMERTTEALERMAEQERRRNDLEERRIKLDEVREDRNSDLRMAGFKGVVIPIVTAILGGLGTALTYYLGNLGG